MWVMRVVDDSFYSAEEKARHIVDIVAGNLPLRYLEAFNADALGGIGIIRLTNDLSAARRFDSFEAVMACWKTVSTVRPRRPDGKPNRPLTAYTIQPEELKP